MCFDSLFPCIWHGQSWSTAGKSEQEALHYALFHGDYVFLPSFDSTVTTACLSQVPRGLRGAIVLARESTFLTARLCSACVSHNAGLFRRDIYERDLGLVRGW